MALDPRDLTLLSQLLDQAMDLKPAERVAWLEALPAEHQRHADALREMLAHQGALDNDDRFFAMPRLPLGDESVAHAGDRIGPYVLLREIGRGGMGSVWLAEKADGTFKRQVALKLPRLAWGAGLAERMAREREIGALLEHPSIARLYDAGVDERGRPYLALEYIDGQRIDAWCGAQGLNIRARLGLFVQVARAVAYAHGRLVVHRDLKPSNVLVTADGRAHLLDFGIAKLLNDGTTPEAGVTQQQGRVLTPHYASPEQVAGETITVQSDVYSLGVLLYELLTNTLPIAPKRSTLGAMEEAILEGDAPPASSRVKDRAEAAALRGEVDAILGKAMHPEPCRRYATADALAQDIERHLNGETVSARPDTLAYRLQKGLRRHWVSVGAVTAVLAALLSGAGVALVQARRANDAAERADIVKSFVVEVFNFNSGAASNHALRKMPAQTLVEHGAKLIEARFPGQPQLQAELHGVVAGIFLDMGAQDLAVEHATKLVAALTVTRAGDEELAKASLLLARALVEHKRFSDSTTHAQRAIALADADSDLQLQARLLLAKGHLQLGQTQQCELELKAVEAALERMPEAPTLVRALATDLRARVLIQANRFDEGLVLEHTAIDQAIAEQGPLSETAAAIRLSLAYSLIVRNRQKEAQGLLDAALTALRARGSAGEMKAALEESGLVRQMVVMAMVDHNAAQAAIRKNLDLVVAKGDSVPAEVRARIEYELGIVAHLWGSIEEAEQLMGQALLHFEPAPEDLWERWRVATWSGASAMMSGHHQRAEKLLQLRVDLRKQMGNAHLPFAAFDHAEYALNLGMQGRFADAFSAISRAPQFGTAQGDSASSDYSSVLPDSRTRLLIDSGEYAAALASMPNPNPQLPDSTERSASFLMTGKAHMRGEALCGLRQYEDGLRWLRLEIEHREKLVSPQEPILARVRAVAGLCALAARELPSARQLATLSRTAFTAQPGVSPYFKVPLIELERKLGLKLPPP